jgi:two-component system invasion response regulator UvrY
MTQKRVFSKGVETEENNQNYFLVTDDHPVIAISLERILFKELSLYKIKASLDPQEILNLVRSQNPPDIIFLDVLIPDINVPELIREILTFRPSQKIFVFTCLPEELHAKRFFKLGVRAYLNKEAQTSQIIYAIRMVLNGRRYIPEKLADILASEPNTSSSRNAIESLSAREYEVLQLLLRGASSSEICNQLNIRPSTVATFKKKIYKKFNVSNLVALYETYKLSGRESQSAPYL